MSISSLGAVGYNYQPQATSFTAKPYRGTEDFEAGFIMPQDQPEKKKKHTVLKTVVTIAALVGTAVFLKKHGKGIWNKIKGLFNKGAKEGAKVAEEGAKTAETAGRKAIEFKPGKDYITPGTPVKVNQPAKPAAEVVEKIETSTANSSSRKAVEQAIKDTPTKAQQAAYNESIRYVAPNAEQKAAIALNNSTAAQATSEAHQIQNLASTESKGALETARQGMSEVNTSLNGLFESNGAKLTLKNGKIVKIQAPDGRTITDKVKIAKYEYKHGIDLSNLTPASAPKAPKAPATPAAPAPATEAVTAKKPSAKKQQEMEAAWQEYTQSNVPTAEEILAKKQGETVAAKPTAPKQTKEPVAEKLPETKAPTQAATDESKALDEMIAQREADAARVRQQELDEMFTKQQKKMEALRKRQEQDFDDLMIQSAASDDIFAHNPSNNIFVDPLPSSKVDDMFTHNPTFVDPLPSSSTHPTGFDDMLDMGF